MLRSQEDFKSQIKFSLLSKDGRISAPKNTILVDHSLVIIAVKLVCMIYYALAGI